MTFNSIQFVLFFFVFFFTYWFVFNRRLKLQNLFVLLGSYLFYAWWDWHFLFLLITSSAVNFILGIYVDKTRNERKRQLFLWVGVLQALGCLFYFKYFNFFIASFADVLTRLNFNVNIHTVNILLPIGISFYTFKTLSYLFDIKRRKIEPTRDWVVFFSYVAFFPSLISGPIDRPDLLIPQLKKKRVFSYVTAVDGLRQILWGLFKKIVIADNCAKITDHIFNSYWSYPASTLLIGAFYYTVQLYADFSGYSDMAIGLAHLLGFNITKNFNYPFFAQNIADYWRRWHISLTSWVTDYVFTPLSITLRHLGKAGLVIAILLNMIIVGIWHGANWTFIIYGFLNGLYFIPLILMRTINNKKSTEKEEKKPVSSKSLNIVITFILMMLTNIIFRLENVTKAFHYYLKLFSFSLFTIPVMQFKTEALITLICIAIMFFVEWCHQEKEHGLQIGYIKLPILRFGIYSGLIYILFSFSSTEIHQFIYFHF